MSSSNKERYSSYSTVGKSRRGSPGDPHSAHAFFPTGQGLCSQYNVLDPRSQPVPLMNTVPHTYSTPYTQPRSAPNKLNYDLDTQSLYAAYPTTSTSPQFPSAFPTYEIHHDRYSPQPSYPTYSSSSRSSPPLLPNPADSRRLPPLSTASTPPVERWPQPTFVPPTTGFRATTNIQSPTATYPAPNQFMPQYQSPHQANNAYQQYHLAQDSVPLSSQPGMFDIPRSNSPFNTASASCQISPPQSCTPPPVSPTSPEEPTVKKKRKRADANQLKVLNETYNRTAFPSTEERIALAKMLDMSARSVQIWFQNKRQSMRQTNRQSVNSSSTSHNPFSMTSQVDPMSEDLVPPPTGFDVGSGPNSLYLEGPSVEAPRSHASHPTSHYGGYHPSSRHRE